MTDEKKIRDTLGPVRCFLLDMDGTFYLGDRLLPGSLRFLDALKDTGREAIFLTNNSSRSSGYYVEKLRRMGVKEPFLRVLTSGQAAGRHCLAAYPGQKAYLLGNSSLRAELEAMGMAFDDGAPDYVLIGYDTELTYRKMWEVCNFVRAGLPYIATHPDFNCPTEDGFAPDIGAIIAFIRASAGREPDLIIGKPHPGIVKDALLLSGLPAEALAMVGDRLYTDIETALRSGMTGILVLSGETDLEMLRESKSQPHLVFGGLADMIPYL